MDLIRSQPKLGLTTWLPRREEIGNLLRSDARLLDALRGRRLGRLRPSPLGQLMDPLLSGSGHLVARHEGTGARTLVHRTSLEELEWTCAAPEELLPNDGKVHRHGYGNWPLHLRCSGLPVTLSDLDPTSSGARPRRRHLEEWTSGTASRIELGESHPHARWHLSFRPASRLSGVVDVGAWRAEFFGVDGPPPSLILDVPATASEVLVVVQELLTLIKPALTGPMKFEAAIADEGTAAVAVLDWGISHLPLPIIEAGRHQIYFDAAASTWMGLSDAERRMVSILVDMMMLSHQPKMEPSIALAASALELSSTVWMPKGKDRYDVPKAARAAIRAAVVGAARCCAPGTEYAATGAAEKVQHIFNRSARDRLGRLRTHWDLTLSDEDIAHFVRVRNSIAHGGFEKKQFEERLKALLIGRWLLDNVVVRRLGYTGPTYDWTDYESG